MSNDRLAVSRRIAAPAHEIFAIVAHPAGHVRIDGSGMVRAASDAQPLSAVGDTFEMEMDRRPLNDIPNLTDYRVRNTVTRIVPDRLIEWQVAGVDRSPIGHVYGWEIEPVGDSECEVTNYCDWTGVSEKVRAFREWPVVPVEMMQRSVENLERIATRPDEAAGL